LLGDNLLGQIYLTNKESHFEFTEDDEGDRNPGSLCSGRDQQCSPVQRSDVEQEQELGQRNEDMALLNDIAQR
jgi:hypothetical protein